MVSISSPTAPSRAPLDVTESARAGWETWRDRRLARVTAPRGDLALIETRWLDVGSVVTDEEALAGRPASVSLTRMRREDLDTGEDQYGYRLWDSAAPSIIGFEGIESFPFDAAWVVEAWFEPVDQDRTIPFEHLHDNGVTRDLVVPGDITFSLLDADGEPHEYVIAAFDNGGSLLVPFGDLTNRSTDPALASYPTGRFLIVQRLDGTADAGTPGTVLLDFNRAYVPPCGFSPHYNCPLPPAQNRLDVAVTAGERAVRIAA